MNVTRYANVTATVALVIALGGTSYAAVVLPADSVGTRQIRNKAVARADIRSNAVTSGKVRNGSLLRRDFASGQLLAGPAGAAGPKGDPGPAGPKGDKGDTGGAGSLLWAFVRGADAALARTSPHAVSAARIGEGEYHVVFDQDVSQCVYTAALGGPDVETFPGEISVARRIANSSAVLVKTYDSAGVATNLSFSVVVHC